MRVMGGKSKSLGSSCGREEYSFPLGGAFEILAIPVQSSGELVKKNDLTLENRLGRAEETGTASSDGNAAEPSYAHRVQLRRTQLRPLVPGDEPPNWELPVPLNEVGPFGSPFGLP